MATRRRGFDLKENVLASLRVNSASPAMLAEAQKKLETLKAPAHPDELLLPDVPVAVNPLFRRIWQTPAAIASA